jgi:hypothetical protein
LDEELPNCPRPTISAHKRMLLVFWDQTHWTRQLARKRCANQRGLLPWRGIGRYFPEAPSACLRRTQTMDMSAYGQRKGPHSNSRFNCHAGFETRENTPTPLQSRHKGNDPVRNIHLTWQRS